MPHLTYQDCSDLQTAHASWNEGNFKRSLQLFERCVKKHPHNLRVYQDACQAFAKRYELAKAHTCVSRVLKFGGKQNGDILAMAGRMWQLSYRPNEAISCFHSAISAKQPSLKAHLDLAKIYERSGNLSKAMEHAEAALHTQPNDAEMLRFKGHIYNRLGQASDAEKLFARVVENKMNHTSVRAHAFNAWAHLLDQQCQYDEAFEKLRLSKALLRSQPNIIQLRGRGRLDIDRLDHLIQSVDSNYLESWSESGDGEKHFFLTGCPRSGTTLIEKILDSHSGIISADEYEAFPFCVLPDFLAGHHDDRGFYSAENLDQISLKERETEGKRYLKFLELSMGEKVGGRCLIDKNPGFTGALPVLLRLLPKTRIIYALRDPRDIAISSYFRWLDLNPSTVSYLSMEETCQRTSDELGFWLKLREVLPSSSWRETRYEDTVADADKEAKQILSWMDLEWEDGMGDYREHLTKRGVNSPTYEDVSKPIYKTAVNRWQHYEKHLGKATESLENCLKQLKYS